MMNHPLVKKEWKSLKWLMLLYSCLLGFFAIILSENMAQLKTAHLLTQYRQAIFTTQLYSMGGLLVPMLLISLMIVVGILFIHDRNSQIGKFINSLPYTRKEQFKIKYLMGLMTFTVPLVFFGGILCFIRGNHQDWIGRIYQYNPLGDLLKSQDSVRVLLLWLILLWLVMVGTYSFLMMIQTLMGQSVVASVVGGITFLVPLFLGYAIPGNLSLLSVGNGAFNFVERLTEIMAVFLFGNPKFKYLGNISILNGRNLFDLYTDLYGAYDYKWFPLYMVVLLIASMVCTLLGCYFIQHNDVGKNGEIALYPWVAKLLVIGSTLCSLLLLPLIIVIFTGIENLLVSLIAMVIGGVVGYFMSYKSIEMAEKNG